MSTFWTGIVTSFFEASSSAASSDGSSPGTTASIQHYQTGSTYVTGTALICPTHPTQSGSYAVFALTRSDIGSALPNQLAYFSAPLRDILGNTGSITLSDIKQIILRTALDAPISGVVIWGCITSGAMGVASNGFGVKLEAFSGSWRVGAATNAGVSWQSSGSSTATTTTTVGAVGHAPYGVSNQQVSRVGAFPLDAADTKIGTANTGYTAATVANVGNDLDTVSFGAGWLDAVPGKPVSASVSVKVDIVAATLANLSLPAR